MTDSPQDAAVAPASTSEPQTGRDPFEGMTVVDLTGSRRLPVLMEMVAGLSRAGTPQEVLHVFSEGFDKLYGSRGYVSISTRGLAPGQYKITRLITEDMTQQISVADPWKTWTDIPVSHGGFFGRLIRTAYPQIIHDLAIRDDPAVGNSLAKFGSLLAIPLFDDGEPLNWAITLREDPKKFTIEELEDAVLRSNLGGTMVKNVVITQELRKAHDAIRHEVEQIAKIQRALLPKSIPDIPGLEIGVSYEMFDQAGGDMYALRPLRPLREGTLIGAGCCDPSGPWGILVADVSGHGPAAAVVMAMMRAIFDAYPHEPKGPAEILEHANHHLVAKQIEQRFVTAFFALYDPTTRRFTYARAGHNPPVWMRPAKGGRGGWNMTRLDSVGGVPLGITRHVAYEEATIGLKPGETVVLYTDGITEAMSPDRRMFGIEGIEGALTECSGEPDCVIGHIAGALEGHLVGVRPDDDQTLVVIRVVS